MTKWQKIIKELDNCLAKSEPAEPTYYRFDRCTRCGRPADAVSDRAGASRERGGQAATVAGTESDQQL